jgi:hypothetical protein
MGGAFVGLADDGNALFFNSAGLGGLDGLSALSSGEVRRDLGILGQVAVVLPRLGLGIHFLDLGDVPQVDEVGNVIGHFSYRTYALVAGAGIRGADVAFLRTLPLLRDFGLGLKVKFLTVSTLDPGSGSGLAVDLSFFYGWSNTGLGTGSLTGLGLGLVLENLAGVPIKYGSGHEADWLRGVVIGTSVTLFDSWTVVADFAPGKGIRTGLEWLPVPAIAVRAGLRSEGAVIWSLGFGVRYGMFALDYAFVTHPHLAPQHRLSFGIELSSAGTGQR